MPVFTTAPIMINHLSEVPLGRAAKELRLHSPLPQLSSATLNNVYTVIVLQHFLCSSASRSALFLESASKLDRSKLSKMSRSAIDRRHKAKWPVDESNQRPSTASTSTSRLLGIARSIRQGGSKRGAPAEVAAAGIELPEIEPPKPVQRKPIPRGPTERSRFSGMVEMLNEDRFEPGEILPVHEPKSHFDWESEKGDSTKVCTKRP